MRVTSLRWGAAAVLALGAACSGPLPDEEPDLPGPGGPHTPPPSTRPPPRPPPSTRPPPASLPPPPGTPSGTGPGGGGTLPAWSTAERTLLRDLRLVEGPAAADPSNRVAAREDAARLGQRFFFDRGFSANGAIACASCHRPDLGFQDGRPQGRGLGAMTRRTPPLAGVDAATWLFWDGRRDSLWAQALAPLESAVEHGTDRAQVALRVAAVYRADYEAVFGPLPELAGVPAHASPLGQGAVRTAWDGMTAAQQQAVNRVFSDLGKAIGAYEARLQPGVTRFDRFVDAVEAGDGTPAGDVLSSDEQSGLRLFIGRAQCVQCHQGPHLTNGLFANVGVPTAAGLPQDPGRSDGVPKVKADPFNCLGAFSDAPEGACAALVQLRAEPQQQGQFKIPSLRGVAERAPYMHAGQLATLDAVVGHYNAAPAAPVGQSEVVPLGLSATERSQLVAFLRTLSAPPGTDAAWLQPPP